MPAMATKPTTMTGTLKAGSSPSSDPTATSTSTLAQYATFLHPDFEADAYAHAVLKGEDYQTHLDQQATGAPPPGPTPTNDRAASSTTGDVSAALARLNFGVEDLNRQLKAEVRENLFREARLPLGR